MSGEVLTLKEVLERLRAAKAKESGVDPQEVRIRERTHVEKFDGGRADILAGLKPSEYVILEDGKVVHREVQGQPVPLEGDGEGEG